MDAFPRVGVGSAERLANIGQDFVHKVWDRVEDAAANAITGDHAQPEEHFPLPSGKSYIGWENSPHKKPQPQIQHQYATRLAYIGQANLVSFICI